MTSWTRKSANRLSDALSTTNSQISSWSTIVYAPSSLFTCLPLYTHVLCLHLAQTEQPIYKFANSITDVNAIKPHWHMRTNAASRVGPSLQLVSYCTQVFATRNMEYGSDRGSHSAEYSCSRVNGDDNCRMGTANSEDRSNGAGRENALVSSRELLGSSAAPDSVYKPWLSKYCTTEFVLWDAVVVLIDVPSALEIRFPRHC